MCRTLFSGPPKSSWHQPVHRRRYFSVVFFQILQILTFFIIFFRQDVRVRGEPSAVLRGTARRHRREIPVGCEKRDADPSKDLFQPGISRVTKWVCFSLSFNVWFTLLPIPSHQARFTLSPTSPTPSHSPISFLITKNGAKNYQNLKTWTTQGENWFWNESLLIDWLSIVKMSRDCWVDWLLDCLINTINKNQ